MEADIREFILEHLKEHRKEVRNRPIELSAVSPAEFVTHSSLPSIGASPLIWVPRAARTC